MAIEVIGLGAMNLDHLYRVGRILADGEASVEEFCRSPGGSAANTIYALAKLGVSTGFVGAVGEDEEGKRLIQDLASVGVDTRHIRVKKEVKTGFILGLVAREGQRVLYAFPGANSHLVREDIDMNYIHQARFLHLSAFVHDSQFQLQRELVAGLPPQVKVSFAPGSLYTARGLEALAPLLRKTFILFINRREIMELVGEGFPQGARRLGCPVVVVTLGGEEGMACYIREGEREYEIRSRRVLTKVKDSTGAGDAFAAGFLYGLLRGENIDHCALLGEIMAAGCLSQLGARPGLPTLAQLREQVQG